MSGPNLDKIDQKITDILLEHLVLANDNGQPYIQYTDVAVDKIITLIATQVQEARRGIADDIGKMVEIQGDNGNWNYDQYMHGMYNGMEFCHSLVKGVEPKYRNAPKQWLADIPMPTDAEPIQDIAQLRSTQ